MTHPPVSDDEIRALRDLVTCADSVNTPLLAVGATARELVFNRAYGIPSHRSTTDWDFGASVPDWATFWRLRERATAGGAFEADLSNTG
jgi:predicted nucleotidyltransferase